ncbi:hypothetical protein TSAR_006018 [Trichomalopsis sarcophagae]|uniref:Uncharacterized protein n=1 Tax=Trichomalopsis sarcophagae TaxID=543379 RepID=A0A232EEL8_9HYME|nr:hypothetical protein TSAR_006018 [Trichomalopsis sarcophagae]
MCKGEQFIMNCKAFITKNPKERKQIVIKKGFALTAYLATRLTSVKMGRAVKFVRVTTTLYCTTKREDRLRVMQGQIKILRMKRRTIAQFIHS